MSSPPTAATAVRIAQVTLWIVGVALLAAWCWAPKLKRWRSEPPRMRSWDAKWLETALVVWVASVAFIILGPLFVAAVAKPGEYLKANWHTLVALAGQHIIPLLAVASGAAYARYRKMPLPSCDSPERPGLEDEILLGAAVFAIALAPVMISAQLSVVILRGLNIVVSPQSLVGVYSGATSPGLLFAFTVVGVILAPINEEFLFRAGLFRILRAFTPRWVALALSAVIFAALHIDLPTFLPLAVLGAILAYAYEKTGSLVVPVVAHGLFNLNSIIGIISGLSDLP